MKISPVTATGSVLLDDPNSLVLSNSRLPTNILPISWQQWFQKKFLVQILALENYQTGASHQHIKITAKAITNTEADNQNQSKQYVVKIFPYHAMTASHNIACQFQLYDFFFKAGVKTPKPLLAISDRVIYERDFLIMQHYDGISDGQILTVNANLPNLNLTSELAQELAKIHNIYQEFQKQFSWLIPKSLRYEAIKKNNSKQLKNWELIKKLELKQLAEQANFMTKKLSVVTKYQFGKEWQTQFQQKYIKKLFSIWHDLKPLEISGLLPFVVLHGDFRVGNFLLIDDKTAIKKNNWRLNFLLDWEFTNVGLWLEDLGWFTAPAWRYHNPEILGGGLINLTEFYHHYQQARNCPLPPLESLPLWWFQALALLRWAFLLQQQFTRKLLGQDKLSQLLVTSDNSSEIFTKLENLLEQKKIL